MALVSELIKSALENKEFLSSTKTQKLEVAQADKNEYDWIVAKVKSGKVEQAQLLKELAQQKSKFNSSGVKRILQNIVKRPALNHLPKPTSLSENEEMDDNRSYQQNETDSEMKQEQENEEEETTLADSTMPKDGLHST